MPLSNGMPALGRTPPREPECAGTTDVADFVQPPVLSIVVCTYNRCAKLATALRAIGQSCCDHACEVELVVVDNNSTDETRCVIENFARDAAMPVRYVRERRQGLCYARNRGVRESRGEIVAFTDDDCIVDANWIDIILREFGGHPEIGLIGGRVDLNDPQDCPVTIRPFDRRVRYAGLQEVFTLIIGCNLAFRRNLVEQVGPFDAAFGGVDGVVADDIDFIYRAVRQGLVVEFVPEMAVRHDHGRRHAREIDLLNAAYVRGRGAFYTKYALRADGAVVRVACREIAQELMLIVRRFAAGEAIGGNFVFLARLASGGLRFARSRLLEAIGGER